MTIEVQVRDSTKKGKFFWRIVEVGNHSVIATGNQLFTRKAKAQQGYDNVEGEIVSRVIAEKDLLVYRKEDILRFIEKLKEGEFTPDQLLDVSVYKG